MLLKSCRFSLAREQKSLVRRQVKKDSSEDAFQFMCKTIEEFQRHQIHENHNNKLPKRSSIELGINRLAEGDCDDCGQKEITNDDGKIFIRAFHQRFLVNFHRLLV